MTQVRRIFRSFSDLDGKKYILVGFANTIFGYFSSVYLYIFLEYYFYDFIIFILAGILGIIFSYLTMSLIVMTGKSSP